MRGAGMAEHGAISHVFFGLDPMWVSTVLLLITYATIITEKVNRVDHRASRRRRDDPGRRAEPGRGDPRDRLQHHRSPHRHDDPGLDLAPLRHVRVHGGMGGKEGKGAPGRHPAPAPGRDRGALGAPRQRHDGASDRAGDARDHPRAQGSALSLPLRRGVRLEHRRHRDAHRRSAEHPDRLARRALLQRVPDPSDAGDRRRHGGAARDDPPALGQGHEGDAGGGGAGHGDERRRHDPRSGPARSSRSW